MKRPVLISMLILLMLMSFTTASVFAQDQAAEDEVTEVDDSAETDDAETSEDADGEATDEDASDSEDAEDVEEEEELIEPVELVYVEYPCVEADGTLIDVPLGAVSHDEMDDDADGESSDEESDDEDADGEDADSEDAEDEDADTEESDDGGSANVAFGRFNLVSRQEDVTVDEDAEISVTSEEDADAADAEEGEEVEGEEGEEEEIEYPDCVFIEVEPEPIIWKDPEPPVNPWYGSYWNNPEFTGPASLQRRDDFVNFNWGNESPYTRTMGADYNSIRWTHNLHGQAAGFYEVRISSDYGARVDVNGARIVDTVRYGNASPFNAYYFIEGDAEFGRSANIKFDYYHHTGPSVASISVKPMGEWAAPFGYATIVGGSPVLRDGPGTSYWSNGRLAAGERVKLAGHRNAASNWIYVIDEDGIDGWLNVFYLNTSTPIKNLIVWPFKPDGVTGAEPSGTASRDFPYINLRYNPTSDSAVISQVPPGQRVVLVGRNSSNTQLLVRMWDGTLGWASRGGIDTGYNINALDIRWVNSAEATE